uniref:Candidate secreted effector n=1 Tax=Meloidogyne incognita TaxID=6306 RepID=A0A914MUM7_MELIC
MGASPYRKNARKGLKIAYSLCGQQTIADFEKASTSKALRTEEIEEEKVHTKEGAAIVKQNEGEEQVVRSSHISDKDIPHHPVQARGAQPEIVGDKGWSCKPKTVKSKKEKVRKQHKQQDNTKHKTEGTMKDLIDQDKPMTKPKLWRRLNLLGC